jgi:hypothetical protein
MPARDPSVRAIRARLTLPEEYVHPMHAFVADTAGFEQTRLLHWNPSVGETNTLVFHVLGDDSAAYASALASVPTVVDYDLSDPPGTTGFHLAVQEDQRAADARLTNAFVGTGVVVVPPVVYRSDRTIDVALVGTATSVGAALDLLPDPVDSTVRWVGGYDGRFADPTVALSPRQREALAAAVELGYYGDPREASVADVAAELDCATGTAAEHLRKAEAVVLRHAVDRGVAGVP